jgi:hypothetical protein
MSRRNVLVAVIVTGFAAALVALIMRFGTTGSVPDDAGAPGNTAEVPQEDTGPPTSEALIAEALASGDITYEQSLRARAYAIFNDPRLEPAFRSPVANWEALGALLDEVDEKEATLSEGLLDDLLPFRVRPNDPRSILNRPREEVQRTQASAAPLPWVGEDIAGTDLRVWIQGTRQDLQKYSSMAAQIWKVFPAFFRYPLSDAPGRDVGTFNSREVNPNNKVDIYLIDATTADPRLGLCQDCALGTNAGWAKEDPDTLGRRTGSGYILLGKNRGDDDTLDTMAHELAHVAQRALDWDERNGRAGAEAWFPESTATYVAHKVMIALGKSREFEYRLLDSSLLRLNSSSIGPPLFQNLHKQLHRTGNDYSGFLFFFYASQELGDDVVMRVWQVASAPGAQGIDAVDQVIKLQEHFPRFTVRNWNRDPVLRQYKDNDSTFPRTTRPSPIEPMPSDLGLFELAKPVVNLSARYYRFTWFDPKVRKVTFQNFYKDLPNAHVWAIKKILNDWKEPEDWSRDEKREFCRESPDEAVTELILIVSDSHPRQPIDPALPKPRVLVEDVGCEFIEGDAQSTLRLTREGEDVTYTSNNVTLRFRPRTVQDQPGAVLYDLMSTSVTWTVRGTRNDCTLDGSATVVIPEFIDQPVDPLRPAYGYLNVVGADGGDFHSIEVSASDPNARIRKTCPGNPPRVTMEPLDAVWLSHVLSQKNTHSGSDVTFVGNQTVDPERFQDMLPQAARDFIFGNPTLGPTAGPGSGGTPGAAPTTSPFGNLQLPPDIDPSQLNSAIAEARRAMQQQLNVQGGHIVYTFKWNLKPMTGAPPAP